MKYIILLILACLTFSSQAQDNWQTIGSTNPNIGVRSKYKLDAAFGTYSKGEPVMVYKDTSGTVETRFRTDSLWNIIISSRVGWSDTASTIVTKANLTTTLTNYPSRTEANSSYIKNQNASKEDKTASIRRLDVDTVKNKVDIAVNPGSATTPVSLFAALRTIDPTKTDPDSINYKRQIISMNQVRSSNFRRINSGNDSLKGSDQITHWVTTAGNDTAWVNPSTIYNAYGTLKIEVTKISSDANWVVIVPTSGTINGLSYYAVKTQYQSVLVWSDNTNIFTSGGTFPGQIAYLDSSLRQYATISDLVSSTGTNTTALVTSTDGGLFYLANSSATIDSGIVHPATGHGVGYRWIRSFTGLPDAKWWGVSKTATDNGRRLNAMANSPYVFAIANNDTTLLEQPVYIRKSNFTFQNNSYIGRVNTSTTYPLTANLTAGSTDIYFSNANQYFKPGDHIGVLDTVLMAVAGGNGGQIRHKAIGGTVTAVYSNHVTIAETTLFSASTTNGAYAFRTGSLLCVDTVSGVKITGGVWDGCKSTSIDAVLQYSYASSAVEDGHANDVISLFAAPYTVIEKAELKNSVDHLIRIGGAADYTKVLNNNLHDAHDKCVVIPGLGSTNVFKVASNVTIQGNTIANTDFEDGIALQNATDTTGLNLWIDHNTFINCGRYAINAYNTARGSGLKITNNYFANNGIHIWIGKHNGVVIDNNTFRQAIRFRHNQTFNNSSFPTYSIAFDSCTDVTVTGCTFDTMGTTEGYFSYTGCLGNLVVRDCNIQNMQPTYYGTVPAVFSATYANLHLLGIQYRNVDSSKIFYSRSNGMWFGGNLSSTQYNAWDDVTFYPNIVQRRPYQTASFGVKGTQFATSTTYSEPRLANIGRVNTVWQKKTGTNISGPLIKGVDWDTVTNGFKLLSTTVDTGDFYWINVSSDISEFYATDVDYKKVLDSVGTSDLNARNAFNNAIIALKKVGLWSACVAWYPEYGTTEREHSFNYRDPTTYRLTYSGTSTFTNQGWGKTSTSWANTGIDLSAVTTLNSIAISYYATTLATTGAGYEMGTTNGGTTQQVRLSQKTSSLADFKCYSTTAGTGSVTATPTTSTGYLVTGSRVSSTDCQIYQDATSLATITGSSGTIPTQPLYLGGYNNNGTATINAQAKTYQSFFIWNRGLTTSEVSALTTIFYKLKKDLGR